MTITSISVDVDLETCLGDELACNAPIQCQCFSCKWHCDCGDASLLQADDGEGAP